MRLTLKNAFFITEFIKQVLVCCNYWAWSWENISEQTQHFFFQIKHDPLVYIAYATVVAAVFWAVVKGHCDLSRFPR